MSVLVQPAPEHLKKCTRCSCTTVYAPVWVAAGAGPTRDGWKGQGYRRHGGRGLCITCYVYLRQHNRLDEYVSPRFGEETAKCARCGVLAGLSEGLCQDCTQVCADLGEREAWVS